MTRVEQALLDHAPDAVFWTRVDGSFAYVNHAACTNLGYTREQLLQRTIFDVDPDFTPERWRTHWRNAASRKFLKVQRRHRRSDGSFLLVEVHSQQIMLDGQVVRFSFVRDLTAQHEHERRMRQAEAIIQSAREGITITDPDRNIERVNAAFSRITGYTEDEVRGRNPRILSSGRQDRNFYRQMWSTIDELDHWQGEIWNRRKNGEVYPEWLSISAIRDSSGELVNYAAVFTDLSELKRSQASLEHLRHFDLLTGLPNRRVLLRVLDEALAVARTNSSRLAVLVCGLDRFRMVNESFSYLTGDHVLSQIADQLRNISDRRVEISRPGSDQFAFVIRSGASRKVILDMIGRISELVARPIEIEDEQPLSVQFSLGVARFPGDGASSEDLVRNAEAAMFQAKRHNRGSYTFFVPSHTEGAQQQLLLETELRQAVLDEVFELHFQPVVAVGNNRIVGAEALARWPRDGKEMVSPAVFIPIAEQSGLIEKLSFQLLRLACRATVNLLKCSTEDFRLAFNISAMQLNDRRFAEKTIACLESAGLDPEKFELELTESTLMAQAGGSSRALKQLRKAGIRLSIDDFGTGFSSLAYLQEIDAQVLKIDRRFINDVASNPADAQIAASIIAMAHALGMEVVAEGVETSEQLAFLVMHECDYYQGYLFSKPLTLDDFEKLYRGQS